MSTAEIVHGDALDVLRGMASASVDAVVTDPPAGIAFMGKAWDGAKGGRAAWVAWLAEIMREALRVLKPGGRALVWAIPRTSHWTACAVEDAGFIIENTIAHFFGSGFPKGKGQLKPAREDWILCRKPGGKVQPLGIDACRVSGDEDGSRNRPPSPLGSATSYAQDEWSRTAIVARQDTTGKGRWPPNLLLSHAPECVEAGTREVKGQNPIVRTDGTAQIGYGGGSGRKAGDALGYADADGKETIAAWTCVDGCPVKMLDEQSGERPSGARAEGVRKGLGYFGADGDGGLPIEANTGTASRFFPQFPAEPDPFFYVAKASRRERNAGCEGLPAKSWSDEAPNAYRDGEINTSTGAARVASLSRNHHPTVKAQTLMRWLVRLIAPPGGTVLDPFAGSGSTLVACIAEGMSAIGVEREAEYVEIARARVAHAEREHAKHARAFEAVREVYGPAAALKTITALDEKKATPKPQPAQLRLAV